MCMALGTPIGVQPRVPQHPSPEPLRNLVLSPLISEKSKKILIKLQ